MRPAYDSPRLFDDPAPVETLPLFAETAPGQFHVDDPWTSKAAARSAAITAGTTRYNVLRELVDAPASQGRTAYEVAGTLGLLAHVAGTRLGELVAAGLAMPLADVDGPIKRRTDTGRGAACYTATLAGITAHRTAQPAMSTHTADRPRSAGTRPPGRPTAPRRPSPRGLIRPIDRILEAIVDATDNPVTAGANDSELGAATGLLATAAGTYRKQLAAAGYVRRTDRTRRTEHGHQRAGIHLATPAGRSRLVELVAAQNRT